MHHQNDYWYLLFIGLKLSCVDVFSDSNLSFDSFSFSCLGMLAGLLFAYSLLTAESEMSLELVVFHIYICGCFGVCFKLYIVSFVFGKFMLCFFGFVIDFNWHWICWWLFVAPRLYYHANVFHVSVLSGYHTFPSPAKGLLGDNRLFLCHSRLFLLFGYFL